MLLKGEIHITLPSGDCFEPAEVEKVAGKQTRMTDKRVCIFLDQTPSEIGSEGGVKCIEPTESLNERTEGPCPAVKYGPLPKL